MNLGLKALDLVIPTNFVFVPYSEGAPEVWGCFCETSLSGVGGCSAERWGLTCPSR